MIKLASLFKKETIPFELFVFTNLPQNKSFVSDVGHQKIFLDTNKWKHFTYSLLLFIKQPYPQIFKNILVMTDLCDNGIILISVRARGDETRETN